MRRRKSSVLNGGGGGLLRPEVSGEVLSVEALAVLLGVSPYSVYKLANEKKIPGFRIGNKYRFIRSEVIGSLRRRQKI